MIEALLHDVLHEEGRFSVNIETIQKKVAEHFDIRLADMTSKRRPENIAFPRQIAMFLSRQLTESSLNAIGEAFGGRDHGTVLHACRLVKDRMEVDPSVRQVVQLLGEATPALSAMADPAAERSHLRLRHLSRRTQAGISSGAGRD